MSKRKINLDNLRESILRFLVVFIFSNLICKLVASKRHVAALVVSALFTWGFILEYKEYKLDKEILESLSEDG